MYTAPAGQTPASLQRCFKTKKAAQRYARRATYLQIIPRTRGLRGYGPGHAYIAPPPSDVSRQVYAVRKRKKRR